LALAVRVQRLQQIALHKVEILYFQVLRQPAVVKAVRETQVLVVVVVLAAVQVVEQAHLVERLRLHLLRETMAVIIQQEMLHHRAVVVVAEPVLLVVMEAETIQMVFQVQAVQV
jgi:hypothetical protein